MAFDMYKDLILDDEYKLRITSKRLTSGKYQVKFFAELRNGKELYGYLLVQAGSSLKEVVVKIRKRLNVLNKTSDAANFHLYHIGQDVAASSNFLIFQ